ncbi:MAG: tRNA pseudouridine(38-40) synthase TruA [Kiritimatiellia bacterium]
MPRYRLDISYDGTAYAGWQIQPNHITIQEQLESALTSIAGQQIKLHGSGRTDQGVHARQQVAHFDLERWIAPGVLAKALNACLPADIRVWSARKVPEDFHARRSAVSKEYRYFIWNAEVLPPYLRFYRAHVRVPLDFHRMQRAAALLVGKRDFAAFSANPNRDVGSTVRTLHRLCLRKQGREITIIAASDGFLYRMVRSIVGFLIRVGEGALAPEEATSILASRRRTARVPTAAPQGLFLWRVRY